MLLTQEYIDVLICYSKSINGNAAVDSVMIGIVCVFDINNGKYGAA